MILKAAERDTSVSALVREFLLALGDEKSDFARRKRLQGGVRVKNPFRKEAGTP